MELLLSNILPLKQNNKSFAESFEELIFKADSMRIATGYISTDSLTEIKMLIESNKGPHLDLMIGMHFFDGITRPQYEAAKYLNTFLISKKLGEVRIADKLKFHGKMYSFTKEKRILASIVGSSNLNSMLDTHRNFETDILLTDNKIINEIDNFIIKTSSTISKSISDWKPDKFIDNNRLLEEHEAVEKISEEKITSIRNDLNGVVFVLPLKATTKHQKSNLNVYFGKGRENSETGFIKPRAWYEFEAIIPKEITEQPNYPITNGDGIENVITVYTDDGWKFKCKISGANNKNFRSYDDLKILGKWIKGRLENNGSLHVGDLVTEDTLNHYGRNNFELKGTSDPKIWLLDFGAKCQ